MSKDLSMRTVADSGQFVFSRRDGQTCPGAAEGREWKFFPYDITLNSRMGRIMS
jgi:hypothetical protein